MEPAASCRAFHLPVTSRSHSQPRTSSLAAAHLLLDGKPLCQRNLLGRHLLHSQQRFSIAHLPTKSYSACGSPKIGQGWPLRWRCFLLVHVSALGLAANDPKSFDAPQGVNLFTFQCAQMGQFCCCCVGVVLSTDNNLVVS
jgi:hypothetical protein